MKDALKVQKFHRAKFIQREQAIEGQIIKLTEELNEKLTFALVKYAKGQDGTISKADVPSLKKEIQVLMFWYAGQLESIIHKGMVGAGETALESERQSHLVYLRRALELLPPSERKEILEKWTRLGKKLGGVNIGN